MDRNNAINDAMRGAFSLNQHVGSARTDLKFYYGDKKPLKVFENASPAEVAFAAESWEKRCKCTVCVCAKLGSREKCPCAGK